ncbi:MAG: uracil-DNA glycosylase family protein [Pseudomonadota bacterium]
MNGSLKALVKEIRACRLCRETTEAAPLPHEPNPVVQISASARILIAGQAPGTRVHASGRPFTDPSGDRLRSWMGVDEAVFYDASKIAIVPMGFCFPGLDAKGGDLPPRKECAPRWRYQLMEHLSNVGLILLIGQYAQAWHLGPARGKSLTATVQNWRDYAEKFSPPILVLPHPSWRNNKWLKVNPWFANEILPHLQRQVKELLS